MAYAACSRFALAVEDASTATYMYGLQHDPEIKPWENAKDLGIKLMSRQEKNELARKEGRAFLLRGEAELRLCDYDAAMRTFQLGCKADSRLGPDALKELRQAWFTAKELCRGWRRAGRARPKRKKAAFLAERLPVLADIDRFSEPSDKALALRNLASIHAKWGMHEDAIELLTKVTRARARGHSTFALADSALCMHDCRRSTTVQGTNFSSTVGLKSIRRWVDTTLPCLMLKKWLRSVRDGLRG